MVLKIMPSLTARKVGFCHQTQLADTIRRQRGLKAVTCWFSKPGPLATLRRKPEDATIADIAEATNCGRLGGINPGLNFVADPHPRQNPDANPGLHPDPNGDSIRIWNVLRPSRFAPTVGA